MKKFYLSLVALCITSSLAWSQVYQQGLFYQHTDGSFSLQFPSGWAQTAPTHPTQAANFLYYQGQTAVAECIVYIEPLIQPVNAQTYATLTEQNSLRSMLSQYQKTAENTVSVGNQTAVWRQFTFVTTQPIVAEQYYLVVGNAAYTFHFATTPQIYTQLKPQFDQIIRGLRIVPVGPMPPQTLPMQKPASYPLIQSQPFQNPVSTYPQGQIEVPALPQTSQTMNENPTQGPAWTPHEAGEGPSTSEPKVSISPYRAPSSAWSLVPYQDPKGRFSIMVPAAWSTMETAGGLLSVSGTGYSLSLEVMPGPAVSAAVDAMQTVKTRGKEILSQGPRQIGSLNGNETIFKDKGLKGEPTVETLFTIKEKGLMINFMAPAQEYESTKNTIDEILNSLKI